MVVWLVLTLYHCGNAIVKHVSGVNYIDVLHGMKIYFCIAIFVYWAQIDLVKTLKILYRCFCVYLIVAFLLCGGFGGGRLTGVVYATRIGQTAAVAFFLGTVLLFLRKKNAVSLFYYMIIPFVVAMLSQTRNAIGMMALATLGFFASTSVRKGLGVLRVLRLCMLLFFGMSFLAFIVYNSSIYQRSLSKKQQNANSYYINNNSTGTFFDIIVGDRLIYYVEGWKFFKSSPMTGIGMWGFRQRYGGDYPLHSEYMVHLCEGGVIAFSLWMFFLFCCAKNIKKMKIEKGYRLLLMFGLIQFLFCGIYAREFFYEFFYPMIAIFIVDPLKVQKQFFCLEYEKKELSKYN